MNKKIKLIKSFAGYPRGEYIFDVDENIYCWVVDKSNYKIHPDIVQWMPSYFEEVEEDDPIDTIISQIERYMEYKETWMVLLCNPPKRPKYSKGDIRVILEQYVN